MRIQNPNCDGGHCARTRGIVRRLPTSSDPHHGAVILCEVCFEYEIDWRRDRNMVLAERDQFPTPDWESVPEYKGR